MIRIQIFFSVLILVVLCGVSPALVAGQTDIYAVWLHSDDGGGGWGNPLKLSWKMHRSKPVSFVSATFVLQRSEVSEAIDNFIRDQYIFKKSAQKILFLIPSSASLLFREVNLDEDREEMIPQVIVDFLKTSLMAGMNPARQGFHRYIHLGKKDTEIWKSTMLAEKLTLHGLKLVTLNEGILVSSESKDATVLVSSWIQLLRPLRFKCETEFL